MAMVSSFTSIGVKILLLLQFAYSSHFVGIKDASFTASDHPCAGFTLTNCPTDEDAIIDTIHGISEEDCQFFCNEIYTGDCKFFIYDRFDYECQMIQEPFEHFSDSCEKVGGPVEPSLSVCMESDDPCKVGRVGLVYLQVYHENNSYT